MKITASDPLSKSKDLLQENIESLKKLFPEIVSEGMIDIDALQELLGEEIDASPERYQFTWAGKSRARREAQKPSTGTLRPAPEESLDWDTTQNLFLEGDNLEVLKLLQKSYHNKVKMIYIDPPYNTGKDFVYPDNYKDNLQNYLNLTGQKDEAGFRISTNSDTAGRYHSNWLNMMYPRLKLARNLLREDGVIFISIDEEEISNILKLTDEIFGEENELDVLVWALGSGTQAGHFTRAHEYVVAFAKSKNDLPFFIDKTGGTIKHGALKKISQANPASDINFPKGSIKIEGEDKSFPNELGASEKQYCVSGVLSFTDGYLDNDITLRAGWAMKNQLISWLNGNETFDTKGQKVLRFYFNNSGILFYEKERGTIHPKTVIDKVGGTKQGGKEIVELFGASVMSFPKPTALINYLINIASDSEDIILDFFAGSATTAHSVLKQNIQDVGNRNFILVQIPEPTNESSEARKAGFSTISEIGKERIRRVVAKVKEEAKQDAKLNERITKGELDLGFKVFKLDSTNLKPWDPDMENLEQSLFDQVENIKENRKEEDVLYEILLKYGLDLTLPITTHEYDGNTVFNVGMGALIVCLSTNITLKTVEGIIGIKEEHQPETCRVVFRDNGFPDDTLKTNAIQNLKRAGIEEVRSV